MEKISSIYPNKPIKVVLLLYGVEIKDLQTFTRIVKMDPEMCIKKYMLLFTHSVDGYDEEILQQCYDNTPALEPNGVFSEEFSNVEVRAAIIRYASAEIIFKALESKVIDECTIHKKYPRVKFKGRYGKPDSSVIHAEDIEMETIERDEYYELIEITDKRILQYLPWGNRDSIIVLKMTCPSSHKDYYEYIDKKVLTFIKEEDVKEIAESETIVKRLLMSTRTTKTLITTVKRIKTPQKHTGNMIRQALAWQMRTQENNSISIDDYSRIVAET